MPWGREGGGTGELRTATINRHHQQHPSMSSDQPDALRSVQIGPKPFLRLQFGWAGATSLCFFT